MRIALYQPDIPQNTGNIFRLAACLGIETDVIGPTGFVFDDNKLKRSMMDYINHLNYKRYIDWDNYYEWVIKNNFRLILLTTKSNKSYINYQFKKNDILLFGKESAGVPTNIHKIADEKLTIPMISGLRSINVSSSVAMVVGEACRQLNLMNFTNANRN